MKKIKSVKIIQNYMVACIAVMLVVISSCSVRTGIKNMLGVPPTEQQSVTGKKNIFNFTNTTCSTFGMADINVISPVSGQPASTASLIFLSTLFVFLFCFPVVADKPRPLYGSIKTPGSLPLFLEYRKLII